VLQSLEVLLPTPDLDLARKVVWKGSRGKLRLLSQTLTEPIIPFASFLISLYCPRFKSLKFLLTNSKVPRDTKKLVAGVGEKKANVSVIISRMCHFN